MNREALLAHLAETEALIVLGEQNIARQREVVDGMRRDGHPLDHAARILATFEATEAIHLADRETLRRQIAQTTP